MKFTTMDRPTDDMIYKAPIIELIEVEVEKGFATTNMENLEDGEIIEW